ncbi:MAG TPA: HupE/UreJ family protein [Pseudomonadales bacterium]
MSKVLWHGRAIAWLIAVALSPTALADDLRPASLTITAMDNGLYQVAWKVPANKGRERLALDVEFDASTRMVTPVRQAFVDAAHVSAWQIERPGGLAGMRVRVNGLDASYTDVLLRATERDQTVISAVLNADRQEYLLEDAGESDSDASAYVVLGIEHILIGFDHLLFVACLVYLSGSKRKLLWTITGFTLAHSVTLFMAALGWVRVPIPPVEAAIALSIVFLALEIARNDPASISVRYPVLVAASFGLLHGFGFASVLADIGLPPTDTVHALLLFNVGVEAGQLVFVAALWFAFHVLSWLFGGLSAERTRPVVSYVAGSVACIWLVTRLSVF